jgi:formylglycine-generating enzyme required for sulfatase activity
MTRVKCGRPVAAMIFALLCVAPGAQSQPTATSVAEQYWKQGNQYREAGQYTQAVAAFKQSIAAYPTSAAHNDLGQAYQALGQNAEAVAAYREAIRLKPNNASAYHNLGALYYLKLNDYAKAEANFREALRIAPDSEQSTVGLGLALDALGRNAEAAAAFQAAIRENPNNAMSYVNLGHSYMKMGQEDQARQVQAALLKINPGKAQQIAQIIDDSKAVAAQVAPAHTTDPATAAINDGNTWFEQARNFYKDKNYAKGNEARGKAIESYQKAIQANPKSFDAWLKLGDVYNEHWMSESDRPHALEAYQKALALKPDEGVALNRVGVAHLYLDQLPEAVTAFERAVQQLPSDPATRFNLGFVYADMGKNDEARKIYDQLLTLDKAQAQTLLEKINKSSRLSSTGPRPKTFPNPNVELVWIKPGSFMMGQGTGKTGRSVTIRNGYYLGKYPVTQAQWQTVMGDNPSSNKNCGNCPVESVNWNDAQAFITRLNSLHDGYRYRLPSEAEWEYAYRGGTTGDAYADGDIGWNGRNSGNKTQPVGQKPPNPFGLYDMGGNVQEWCMDWYLDDLSAAPADGSAVSKANVQRYRVLRGTSYYASFTPSPATLRYGTVPDATSFNDGFRVAADKPGAG